MSMMSIIKKLFGIKPKPEPVTEPTTPVQTKEQVHKKTKVQPRSVVTIKQKRTSAMKLSGGYISGGKDSVTKSGKHRSQNKKA